MKNRDNSAGLFLFALLLLLGNSACEEDRESLSDCSIKAFYKGTAVCHTDEDAAAIQINSDATTLIITNFLELIPDATSLELDDVIYLEYETLEIVEPPAGLLCGPLIVAPSTRASCLHIE